MIQFRLENPSTVDIQHSFLSSLLFLSFNGNRLLFSVCVVPFVSSTMAWHWRIAIVYSAYILYCYDVSRSKKQLCVVVC